MPQTHEIAFKPTNQIWRTYRHFPYKAWYAIGELVDNSTQSFFENRQTLEPLFAEKGVGLQVAISLDTKARTLTVHDNAMGMDLDELRRAVQLAAPPPITNGRSEFGMGLKTACSWLGDKWSVRTKKHGSRFEYSFEIDIPTHSASASEVLMVTEKDTRDKKDHYTIVTISKVRGEVLQTRTVGKIKKYLAEMYREDIGSGVLTLLWDTKKLTPEVVEIMETEFDNKLEDGTLTKEKRTWKKEIHFEVPLDEEGDRAGKVRGWVCIVAPPAGRAKAGFDLIRRGRAILGRPGGYRPERIFGEARNDLINQRLYGELHMDDFPVNHLKDDFLWDTWGGDFEEKLLAEVTEYVKKIRESGKKGKIPAAVVQATNDDLADVLSTEEMAERIHLLATAGPVPLPPTEVLRAEAEALRNQAIPPRVVTVFGNTYRIYHPQGMLQEQSYVRYEGPEPRTIDIFINDNHPHIGGIGAGEGSAEKYQMHALTCVIDAISAHLIAGLGKPVDSSVFTQYKDQLMRVLVAQ